MDDVKNKIGDIAKKTRRKLSDIRKRYIIRLVLRVIILISSILIIIFDKEQTKILSGWNFFSKFSPFHILWGVWIFDMLCQLLPIRKTIALGSQKIFKGRFKPIKDIINYKALHDYIVKTTKSAYMVFIIWIAFIAVISVLRAFNIINDTVLFIITLTFYVCDLICVLIWCPFRLIMKNKCCTTCRIFNWDHLMMFTPMLLVKGFFSISLIIMSVGVWMLWEIVVIKYPERFWEVSNETLRCSNCTDKLCTQYCRKLRPERKVKNKDNENPPA